MVTHLSKLRLVFLHPFDELAAQEARDRGYLSYVSVEFEDGSYYPVTFYDPVRLAQDLEEEAKFGHSCVAIPGMIVVPEVTMDHMNKAIAILANEGFFAYLRKTKPMTDFDAATTFIWPAPVD